MRLTLIASVCLVFAFLNGCKSQAPGTPLALCETSNSCASLDGGDAIVFPPDLDLVWSASGELRTYASPRAADLNGDCVDDIVTGHGLEGIGEPGLGYVTAHDGKNGQELWRVGPDIPGSTSLDQIVGSATLVDLTGDDISDVVIGGRAGTLVAIEGQNGTVLWRFERQPNSLVGIYNFYTVQDIGDVNGDSIPDLLTANGGDGSIAAFEDRQPGFLMVLSGADGSVLGSAQTPDGMETYMSPVTYKGAGDITYILFGTGGETFAGALWRTTLDNVLSGDISASEQLTQPRSYKGVIAPPSLADLNLDGTLDIVVVTFDGQIMALDGLTMDVLWDRTLSGYSDDEVEAYASPAIGYFDNDGAPDVFVNLMVGSWPEYREAVFWGLSGWNGGTIYKQSEQIGGFPSPVAVDLSGDGQDEVLLVMPDFMNGASVFRIVDFANGDVHDYAWDNAGPGTPLIKDLDHDGIFDLVGAYWNMGSAEPAWVMSRRSLNAPSLGSPSWGQYLGSSNNAIFRYACNESTGSVSE